jgi:hypothetical protein
MKFLIKESKLKETIIDSIDKDGLLHTLKLTSMSFTKLFSMIGMDYLTNKIMIQFIKDVVDKNGSFSVYDINEDPIQYNKSGDEYREISYFGRKFVAVDVYSGYNNLGDFHVRYEDIGDEKLMEVFDFIMEVYEDGKLDNV